MPCACSNIIEAIVYYNPIKIFILMNGMIIAGSVLSLLIALFTRLTIFYFLGVVGILMSILVFSLGLIAVLPQKIMVKE
jgi:hypothetical protein